MPALLIGDGPLRGTLALFRRTERRGGEEAEENRSSGDALHPGPAVFKPVEACAGQGLWN